MSGGSLASDTARKRRSVSRAPALHTGHAAADDERWLPFGDLRPGTSVVHDRARPAGHYVAGFTRFGSLSSLDMALAGRR